jgi:predicted ATPase
MAAALARHDFLMRRAITVHGGFVFKTVGDAFCAAFARPDEAVAAAVEAQRALRAEDFSAVEGVSVRMGLHTGTTDERDGDYFGPTVNRVARLMAIGHGGQILVSGAVREAIQVDALADTSFIDLGQRRLKDLLQPEHVWQLGAAGLPADFPPLKALDARPNNLPLALTPLIGREHDIEDVKALIAAHRVVSLLGSGGVGKTRVALQTGADLIDRFEHGVWFADLAPIRDPELVASVVAQALGVQAPAGQRLEDAIAQLVGSKHLLLILDNCEHVLNASAALADAILRNAPGVRILSTSREALKIPGEASHRLPSLAVPGAGIRALRADEALDYGAIGVFVDRASRAGNRFVLTDDNASIVADICRRLDGIPLAIELAAARVGVLSLPNLATRLDQRFKLLTAGNRTALPRQKTLGATIDWSYDLLTPDEQTLFDRLGVFAGSFSLEAVAFVCGDERIDADGVLALVSSLIDKSLVFGETSGAHERFGLLESTRAYAVEKLAALGERERIARRHAAYFCERARAADAGYSSGNAWLASVELEIDNYRAALEWALTGENDALVGGDLAGSLGNFWIQGGLNAEGRYWTETALERVSEADDPRIAARLWLAASLLRTGQKACEAAERAIRLYDALGDGLRMGQSQQFLVFGLLELGRLEEAREANAEALAGFRARGDRTGIARSLNREGQCERAAGNFQAAREHYAEALAAFRALENETWTAMTLDDLAELEFDAGNAELALRLAEEALEIKLRGKHAIAIAVNQTNIAAYRLALGELGAARESALQGLRWAQQAQDPVRVANALAQLAACAALSGDVLRATRLMGYVAAQYEAAGLELDSTEGWSSEAVASASRKLLSEAELARLSAEGSLWTEEQAVAQASLG